MTFDRYWSDLDKKDRSWMVLAGFIAVSVITLVALPLIGGRNNG